MPRFVNFLVQLDGGATGAIAASDFELVILESGYPGHVTEPELAPLPGWRADLSEFEGTGQVVIAYLNVAVTDHGRSYWDLEGDWVVPFAADPDDLDSGVLGQGIIPGWLSANRGLAFGPETDPYPADGDTLADGVSGFVVDFSDQDWVDRVVAEAVFLVEEGYEGVFLDDVGRYASSWFLDQKVLDDYGLDRIDRATLAGYAQDMMRLVIAVSDAITPLGGYVAINGGVDIVAHAFLDGTPLAARFYGAVDGFLMESQYAIEIAADQDGPWSRALSLFGPSGTDLMALERRDLVDEAAFYQWSSSHGILGLSTISDYSELPDTPPGEGGFTISGSDADDLLFGASGADVIEGGAGNDTIYGGGGADTIFGGAGDDVIYLGSVGDAGWDMAEDWARIAQASTQDPGQGDDLF